MNELSNCPKCNALFIKTQFRSVCENCYKEEEQQYETVYTFLKKRENRTATLDEVVLGTGVEEALILKFIRQGRIQLAKFPNLGYPCEKCGTLIREGKLCQNCTADLTNQLHQLEREEAHKKHILEHQRTFYVKTPKN